MSLAVAILFRLVSSHDLVLGLFLSVQLMSIYWILTMYKATHYGSITKQRYFRSPDHFHLRHKTILDLHRSTFHKIVPLYLLSINDINRLALIQSALNVIKKTGFLMLFYENYKSLLKIVMKNDYLSASSKKPQWLWTQYFLSPPVV